MKTIMMMDSYPEEPGSLFPKVRVTAYEAEQIAAEQGARLPTSEEYDRLFAVRPWPHMIYEWSSTEADNKRSIRGGSWFNKPKDARASNRNNYDPARRGDGIGFRLARDILDGEPVPEGWIVVPSEESSTRALAPATRAEATEQVHRIARRLLDEVDPDDFSDSAEVEKMALFYLATKAHLQIWPDDLAADLVIMQRKLSRINEAINRAWDDAGEIVGPATGEMK